MPRPGAEEARFEDGDEILMHLKILRAGRPGRRQRLGHSAADDGSNGITEQRQLSTVDSVAKCCNRAAPRDVHLPYREYRAGVDAGVDQMNRAADRRSFERRPFGNIHPAIGWQQAHMGVEDAEPKGIDQRPAQQAGARMNSEVWVESFDLRDGIGAVQRASFKNRDAVRLSWWLRRRRIAKGRVSR